jgi:phosphoribosyl-ATP pyrophosphohydrolase/phosphoribosyl-AMP cyclohydrolase
MVDTGPSLPLSFALDAEPPPSRSSPPSWNLHAGGLAWPDVIGQRVLKKHRSPPATQPAGFFAFTRKYQQGSRKTMSNMNPTVDFDKMDGLAPGIVQDARTGEVLMLGFLNPISYAKTLETGFVTFWSRTRQKLWMKGETSGNRLRVVSAATDCDNDTLLFRVVVEGDGLVCHEGTVSCFTKPISLDTSAQQIDQKEVTRGEQA